MSTARLPLVLGLVLALAGAVAAKPAPPSKEIRVPVGGPIHLDGTIQQAAWEGAAQRAIGKDGAVLRFLQRDGTLLLGLESPRAWEPGSLLWIAFSPDTEDAGLYGPGAVRLDYEPLEHARPHLLVRRVTEHGEVAVEGAAVARADVRGPGASVEIAIRLADLGIDAKAKAPLRFFVLWMQGRARRSATWPPDLRTAAPPGKRPPDLASSEKWGKLLGWVDPAGPGAFSRTDWEAFLAEDAELARRGQAAHDLARRLASPEPPPKDDDLFRREVIGNLRWIAGREPLTATDLLALARTQRALNHPEAALALLDALEADPAWRGSPRLLYERARFLEAMDRYEDAAAAWSELATRTKGPNRTNYEYRAEGARTRAAQWTKEQALRAADAARHDLPLVLLRTTRGDVLIQLFARDVPKGVEHFLDLVRRREGDRGFYDGTRFHRVEGAFLVQGGDPVSRDDLDAAGRSTGPTPVEVERNPRHRFFRGAVGFARGMALVNGSQFFVLTGSRPALDEGNFTCFGHVVAGMDVVDRLARGDTLLEAVVVRPAPTEEAREK